MTTITRTGGGRRTTDWSLGTTRGTRPTLYLARTCPTTSTTSMDPHLMEESFMMKEKQVTTVIIITTRLIGTINIMKTTFIVCINIMRRITESIYFILTSIYQKMLKSLE